MSEDTTTYINLPEGVMIHHATRKSAENMARMLAAEYPALSMRPTFAEDGLKVTGWTIVHTGSEGENEIGTYSKVPQLSVLLDDCEAGGFDPQEEIEAEDEAEEEEKRASGSVVDESYRQRYREASSNGQTCGDWLAEFLVSATHSIEGFHVGDFTELLQRNGVDMNTKWGRLPESGQKGWVGRYRMNGRQVLEKIVAKSGYVVDQFGNPHAAPAEFIATLRAKHAKWLAKEAKREAAAEAAIREAVEGKQPEATEPAAA